MARDRDPDALLPLTPLSIGVLLALLDGERHGYALLKELERQSGGRLAPGAGTLYAALQRMQDEGLIEEAAPPPGGGDDARRRYYALTRFGREVARAETLRMAGLVRIASAKRLVPALRLAAERRKP
jgi:DNA-binding PadR family transcriptional regulator